MDLGQLDRIDRLCPDRFEHHAPQRRKNRSTGYRPAGQFRIGTDKFTARNAVADQVGHQLQHPHDHLLVIEPGQFRKAGALTDDHARDEGKFRLG